MQYATPLILPVKQPSTAVTQIAGKGRTEMASHSAWLNKEFLETAMRAGDGDNSISVTGYRLLTTGENKGDGYTSDMSRLSIDTESHSGGARTVAVVVKASPSGGERQQVLRNSSLFPREMRMFAETLPKMSRLLDVATPENAPQPFSAKYYHSTTDDQDGSLRIIVMEDLRPSGFQMADRIQGLDLDHCVLTLRTMARFHAASAMLHSIEPESMQLYHEPYYSEPESMRRCMGNFFASMVRSLALEVEHWPEFGNKYAEKIHRFHEDIIKKFEQSVRRDDSSFNVLTHGDLWVNNLLFKYCESTGRVADVRFIDFQTPYFTSPAVDLIYFLFTSPRDDVRASHTSTLLEEYHGTLRDTLAALGYDQPTPTLAWIEEELRRKVSFAFLVSAIELPCVLAGPDGFVLPSVDEYERGKTSNQHIMAGESYRKVMHRLLPWFERNGAI